MDHSEIGTDVQKIAVREPRGARRKRETRTKILQAALRLMAEKGMEAVTINEITEAADVGFGSFYNHFSSKEEIYSSIVNWVFEAFADTLEKSLADISDAAEIISVSVRHTMIRAKLDPLWGRFLVREGFSARGLSGRGLGTRLYRDIERGVRTGRFVASDPFISFVAVGSTVLGAIVAELELSRVPSSAQSASPSGGENLPERSAAMALKILGLDEEEAGRIANASLPEVDFNLPAIN